MRPALLSFERGVDEMGLQPILFPPEALDNRDALEDVVGCLSSWARPIVGYGFKQYLKPVQQAVMAWVLGGWAPTQIAAITTLRGCG